MSSARKTLPCNKDYKGEAAQGCFDVGKMYPWKGKQKSSDFLPMEVHPEDEARGIKKVFGDGRSMLRISATLNPWVENGKMLCVTGSCPWSGGRMTPQQCHEFAVKALRQKALPMIYFVKHYGNKGNGDHICNAMTIYIPMGESPKWPTGHNFTCRCTGSNIDNELYPELL